MSRHQFYVATSFLPTVDFPGWDQPLFPSQNALVATQNLGRDIKPPQGSQNHVTTSIRCRDTTASVSSCDAKTGRPHNQVATSISGRDLTSSQTRSRPHNDVTTSRGPNPQRTLFLFFFSKSSSSLPCYS